MYVRMVDVENNEVIWAGPYEQWCEANEDLIDDFEDGVYEFGGGASPLIIVEPIPAWMVEDV